MPANPRYRAGEELPEEESVGDDSTLLWQFLGVLVLWLGLAAAVLIAAVFGT